ncbi:hypothetical protein D3C81_2022420 [compost metagenome]
MIEDLVEADHIVALGQWAVEGQRLAALGEAADFSGVVEGFDVPARASDGHAIQQFEEIEVQGVENRRGGALLRR